MDLSIVVPATPDGQSTLRFLNSVRDTLDFIQAEIMVIDPSGGRLTALFSVEHPGIMVYECSKAETIGQATKQALQLCKGRYISLWQPDTILAEDCLRDLLNFLDDNPETGMVGPRFFTESGKVMHSAGILPSMLALFQLLGLGTHRRILPHPAEMFLFSPEFNQPAEVDWLMAGGLIIRRETFEEIGWPDADFSPEFATLDLCRRSRRAGWHHHYLPTATIIKHTPPALKASWPDTCRYLLRQWRDLFWG